MRLSREKYTGLGQYATVTELASNDSRSCKLRSVKRLGEISLIRHPWQLRCSRVTPTNEGGTNESLRTSPRQIRIAAQRQLRPAIGARSQHRSPVCARQPRRNPALDQDRRRPLPRLLTAAFLLRIFG